MVPARLARHRHEAERFPAAGGAGEPVPGSLEIETADIADAESVRALGTRLAGRRLDVLFVNAGIGQSDGSTPAAVDEADFARLMLTNALGPVRAIEILEALGARGRRHRGDVFPACQYRQQ